MLGRPQASSVQLPHILVLFMETFSSVAKHATQHQQAAIVTSALWTPRGKKKMFCIHFWGVFFSPFRHAHSEIAFLRGILVAVCRNVGCLRACRIVLCALVCLRWSGAARNVFVRLLVGPVTNLRFRPPENPFSWSDLNEALQRLC